MSPEQVNQIIAYGCAGLAVIFAALGYVKRPKRSVLWVGAICAASAGGSGYYDSFWPMTCFLIGTAWAAFAATNLVSFNWRLRSGLVGSLFILGYLALWPTLDGMSQGKIFCPSYVKDRIDFRLVAGLDLRGGLRLVYTVDVSEAIKDKRDRYYDDMRTELAKGYDLHSGDELPTDETLEKLRAFVTVTSVRSQVNQITLDFKNPDDATTKIDPRFREYFRGDLGDPEIRDGHVVYTIRESAETAIRSRAVAQAKEIILRRVDELGLREATVSTRDEDIIIEVPGQDEASFQNIRDIISRTARLEFKLLDDESDFFAEIKTKAGTMTDLPPGLDFPNETVQVGLDDEEEIKQRVFTYATITKQGEETMNEARDRFRAWMEQFEVPPDREVGYAKTTTTVDAATLAQEETGWRTYLLKDRAEITGDLVRDAAAQPEQGGGLGGWLVRLTFTDQGGSIFERITGANIKRRFAVILDEQIESSPVIQDRIPGGNAVITMGAGDPEAQLRDARDLELVLRSGALPAPISPSNEQRIGPTLGADSVRLGVRGGAVGGVLVLVFMILYYRRAGIIADISVSMNLFLQLAILASFSASMTLPGIAGLALTVGMSVDANVLINERIREEVRNGKSARAAVDLGYSKALSAIIDGHVTTLISGLILAQYGSGPIKGFAVTLIVGTMTSVFCGVVVSRVLFDLWSRRMTRQAKLEMG